MKTASAFIESQKAMIQQLKIKEGLKIWKCSLNIYVFHKFIIQPLESLAPETEAKKQSDFNKCQKNVNES